MKEYLKEIIIALISIAVTAVAIWFFFFSIGTKKETVQLNLYAVVAPDAEGLVCINRPSVVSKIVLPDSLKRKVYASEIPSIFFSVMDNPSFSPFSLISFHENGSVLYGSMSLEQADEIASKVLIPYFSTYKPKRKYVNEAEYFYYATPGNRFFGTVYLNGIWAASYSKKLLDDVVLQIKSGKYTLSEQVLSLRKQLDQNAPLNLMIPAEKLNIYVQVNDSTQFSLNNKWIYADIFTSQNNLCCFGGIPYHPEIDSIYPRWADTLTLRLKSLYPQLDITTQPDNNKTRFYVTICSALRDSQQVIVSPSYE